MKKIQKFTIALALFLGGFGMTFAVGHSTWTPGKYAEEATVTNIQYIITYHFEARTLSFDYLERDSKFEMYNIEVITSDKVFNGNWHYGSKESATVLTAKTRYTINTMLTAIGGVLPSPDTSVSGVIKYTFHFYAEDDYLDDVTDRYQFNVTYYNLSDSSRISGEDVVDKTFYVKAGTTKFDLQNIEFKVTNKVLAKITHANPNDAEDVQTYSYADSFLIDFTPEHVTEPEEADIVHYPEVGVSGNYKIALKAYFK